VDIKIKTNQTKEKKEKKEEKDSTQISTTPFD